MKKCDLCGKEIKATTLTQKLKDKLYCWRCVLKGKVINKDYQDKKNKKKLSLEGKSKKQLILMKQELEKRKTKSIISMVISAILTMMIILAIFSIPLFIIALIRYNDCNKKIKQINEKLGIEIK